MDVELTWLSELYTKPIDMQQIEEGLRESEEFNRRWDAGLLTEEEHEALEKEAEQEELARDADAYEKFTTAAYLLLRQHVGNTWRHGLDLDAIVVRDKRVFWANPGRHRALSDRRWMNGVKLDLWHESILEVLRWIKRHDVWPGGLLQRLEEDQPRVVTWLKNFKFNAFRRTWDNEEWALGRPDGYTKVMRSGEEKEVPPPKAWRADPHSWRWDFLAYDPWQDLDVEVDVKRALARLPEVDRALFIRHHAYGDTIKSLAANMPLGTVNRKLTSAMRKVRNFLNETPTKRGRPKKCSVQEIVRSTEVNPCLSLYRGVADDSFHRQNGNGSPEPLAAPREEKKIWPGGLLKLSDADREVRRQRILRLNEEGTHKQKLIWSSLRYGSIKESWRRCKPMTEFF